MIRTNTHILSLLSAALLALPSFAQEAGAPASAGFEEPPTLDAASILQPQLVKGLNFSVRPEVPTYAGHNSYVIDSDFGVFEADSNALLVTRLNEINAIGKLREVSKSEEYKKAFLKAAESPLLVTKNLVTQPVKTVTGVPKGVWKFMNRAGETVKEVGEKRERNDYEDSNLKSLIGFSKMKRDLALQLGVNPYSSNPVLQKELNGLSWAAFGGSLTVTAALAPVSGGAGLALTALNVTDITTKALRDTSPEDLRMANEKKLLGINVPREEIVTFLNNPAFSPMHQTIITESLLALSGVKGREKFIALANQAADETDAVFFQRCAQLMAALHAKSPISSIGYMNGLPVCVAKDGAFVLPLEWDYITWTANAAAFAQKFRAVTIGDFKPTAFRVIITGVASQRAKDELQALGVQLLEKALPGPLL